MSTATMSSGSRLPAGLRSEPLHAAALAVVLLGLAASGLIRRPPPTAWATDAQAWARADGQLPAIDALRRQNPLRDANLVVSLSITYTSILRRERRALDTFLPLLEYNALRTPDPADRENGLAIRRALAPAQHGPAALVWPRNVRRWAVVGAVLLVLGALAAGMTGGSVVRFVLGFPLLYLLAAGALLLGGNVLATEWGLTSILWALLLGMLAKLLRLDRLLGDAARPGYHLVAAVVLLGASIRLPDTVRIGAHAMALGCLGVAIVWVVAARLSQRLGLERGAGAVLAGAVALGGVPGAGATGVATGADRPTLAHVAALATLLTVPILHAQAWVIRQLGMGDYPAGAWLGGVLGLASWQAPAGTMVSSNVLTVGALLVSAHTLLVAVAVVALAARRGGNDGTARAPAIVAFLVVVLVVSFGAAAFRTLAATATLGWLRNLCFTLAFVAIGLELRPGDLVARHRGRVAVVFLGAQIANLLCTLGLAQLLFTGRVIPPPYIEEIAHPPIPPIPPSRRMH